jgi:hypothetical protein
MAGKWNNPARAGLPSAKPEPRAGARKSAADADAFRLRAITPRPTSSILV